MLNKAYHVYPLNDAEEHFLECVYPIVGHPICPCKCEPTFKEEGSSLLIVHNSFDGREGVEMAKKILNADN